MVKKVNEKKIKRQAARGAAALLAAVFFLLTLTACGGPGEKAASERSRGEGSAQIDSQIGRSQLKKVGEGSEDGGAESSGGKEAASPAADGSASGSSSVSALADAGQDIYPYNIAEDRRTFDGENLDIVVGDRHYMTQINDWFINFEDYANKTVEIDGYYMKFGSYTFVGRKGPSCPYCTGGYVNFEFASDQDLSGLKQEESWIRVRGILREGQHYKADGKKTSFHYIEAIEVLDLGEVGLDTITD